MGVLENARYEKFAQGVAQGLSQRKAYREAFPNSKKWKDETVDPKASNLAKDDKVSARINELKNASTSKAIKTAIERKEWLSAIIDEEGEDTTTKLKACDLLHKMDGEYTTKTEADVSSEMHINIELVDE